jgi:hypothetical protein
MTLSTHTFLQRVTTTDTSHPSQALKEPIVVTRLPTVVWFSVFILRHCFARSIVLARPVFVLFRGLLFIFITTHGNLVSRRFKIEMNFKLPVVPFCPLIDFRGNVFIGQKLE